MKRIILFLIGLLIIGIACQDEALECENDLLFTAKSARNEKIKTFDIKAHVFAIPNMEIPPISCSPSDLDIAIPGSGWVSGHENIFGHFVQEESTYHKEFCTVESTLEGPEIYMKTNVILTRSNGDQMFVENHSWFNALTGEITGYSLLKNGTGRFEGATGKADMYNGVLDPGTGIASWYEEGYITLIIK